MLETKLFFLGWSSGGRSSLQSNVTDHHNDSAHVHLEEPGNQDWEGFWTGTQAAAAGGVTALIDMPIDSSPPTTTPRNLDIKRRSACGQCWVDVGFWGGAIPQNQVSASAGPSAPGVHYL
jgi:dihydroorotase-like cyclic amidohydrolase